MSNADGQIKLLFDVISILGAVASNAEISKDTRQTADKGLQDAIVKLKTMVTTVTSSLKL